MLPPVCVFFCSFNQMTGKMERVAPSASSTPTPGASSGSSHFATTSTGLLYGEPSLSLGVADEYNPLCPNDYEDLARLKREKRSVCKLILMSSNFVNMLQEFAKQNLVAEVDKTAFGLNFPSK